MSYGWTYWRCTGVFTSDGRKRKMQVVKIIVEASMDCKNGVKYYLKYQCATAPDITITWHPTMNSDTHISPMRYTHHIYFTHVASTYSTRVNAKVFNNSLLYLFFFFLHQWCRKYIGVRDTLLLKLSREKSIFFSSTNGLFSPTELKFKGSNMLFLYICTDFVSG